MGGPSVTDENGGGCYWWSFIKWGRTESRRVPSFHRAEEASLYSLEKLQKLIIILMVYPCDSRSVVSDYSPWNSPDQHTGEGSHSLLQGIFPTQESNPGLQHCRWILFFFFLEIIHFIYFFFLFNVYFSFLFFILLYSTVLVLPYIDVNLPRVYMSSQS